MGQHLDGDDTPSYLDALFASGLLFAAYSKRIRAKDESRSTRDAKEDGISEIFSTSAWYLNEAVAGFRTFPWSDRGLGFGLTELELR